jgi:hypothetical protein
MRKIWWAAIAIALSVPALGWAASQRGASCSLPCGDHCPLPCETCPLKR